MDYGSERMEDHPSDNGGRIRPASDFLFRDREVDETQQTRKGFGGWNSGGTGGRGGSRGDTHPRRAIAAVIITTVLRLVIVILLVGNLVAMHLLTSEVLQENNQLKLQNEILLRFITDLGKRKTF